MDPLETRPVARPIASSPASQFPLLRCSIGPGLAHDIGADRLSAPNYRSGVSGDSERAALDVVVLHHVHRFRVMSGRQLSTLFFEGTDAGRRAARRLLLRLVKSQGLARLDRRIGGIRGGSAGYLYVLGVEGQRLLGDGRRVRRHREPGWAFLAHTLAITELYVEAVTKSDRHPSASLVRFDPEPHSWRQHLDGGGVEHHLRPDAFAVVEHPDRRSLWFVEIDRGTEGSPTLRRKIRQYAEWFELGIEQQSLGAFPRVLWHAETAARRAQIERLASEVPGPEGLHTTTGFIQSLKEEPP